MITTTTLIEETFEHGFTMQVIAFVALQATLYFFRLEQLELELAARRTGQQKQCDDECRNALHAKGTEYKKRTPRRTGQKRQIYIASPTANWSGSRGRCGLVLEV